jgi:hypothetical protein
MLPLTFDHLCHILVGVDTTGLFGAEFSRSHIQMRPHGADQEVLETHFAETFPQLVSEFPVDLAA